MKNSGREWEGCTEVVLDVRRRDTEVLGDVGDRLPRLPAAEHALDRRRPSQEDGLTECSVRICSDERTLGCG